MIELVRDLRAINVLAKFENDPRKIMDVRVLTGLVCPAARPLGVRQYPGALKGCGVKRCDRRSDMDGQTNGRRDRSILRTKASLMVMKGQLMSLSYFKLWRWNFKVKIMGVVKGKGHVLSLVSDSLPFRFTSIRPTILEIQAQCGAVITRSM